MSSTGDVALVPGAILTTDNKYNISGSVKALNLYTWTGSLLPTTRPQYCTHLGIASVKDSLGTMTDNLLTTYKTIKSNSDTFRYTTYPKIVSIAGDIYNYAGEAGGTATTSYYAAIMKYLKSLNEAASRTPPAPQTELDGIKANIRELIDYQIASIREIQEKAAICVKDLQDYEQLCGVDQRNLQNSLTAFSAKLTGTSGDIAAAEANITAKRQELANAQAEYEEDVKIAATTVTYAWVWPIGPIIAAVVAGVYADKAIKMNALITAIKDLLSTSDTQLRADKAVYADLGFMKTDLQKVLELIGPAITAVQKMKGDWEAVASDLESVKTQIGKANKVGPAVLRLAPDQVVEKWNTLKAAVDVYRRSAFVTQPDVKTLAQISTDYSKAAKK